ncbi:hypothetical protein ACS0TY_027707 [Phlomoides rotata]
MECRAFEITVISATNLADYSRFCRIKVYARVSIGGGPDHGKRTPTDYHGAENPAWNYTMKYTLNESMVQHYNTMLVVKLFSKRRLACDMYIGEVHTSVKELFDYATSSGGSAILTLPMQKGSVESQGSVRFSIRFGESVSIDKLMLAETVARLSQC